MTRYARIDGGQVAEFLEPPPGFTLADSFHPAIVAALVAAPDEAEAGWSYDGEAFAPPVPAPIDLVALKADLKVTVDTYAERLRLALITPGFGQAMEYQATESQAVAALADPDPQAGAYPMLEASIGIDVDPQTGAPATDVLGVARSVLAARDLWIVIGADIRAARLQAKAAIDAAATAEDALAASQAAAWPSLSG